jgi:hypothetical protein
VIREANAEHWLNGEQFVRYEIGSEEWKSLLAQTPQGANPEFGQPTPGRVALQSNKGTCVVSQHTLAITHQRL